MFLCGSVCALQKYTALWTSVAAVGPTRFGPKIKYYLDSQLRFIDNQYKFEETCGSAGLGKEINDNWLIFFVNRFLISKSVSSGTINYEYRLWEEANWNRDLSNGYNLSTRSRLEERKRFSQNTIAWRFRQRIMNRAPISNWDGHTFVVSEEVFFNLNRPEWVTDKLFAENRAFIGIGSKINKRARVDIGYMNRYRFGDPQQMTNILLISFNFTGKSDYNED